MTMSKRATPEIDIPPPFVEAPPSFQHPDAITLSIVRKDSDEVQLSWASRPAITYTIEWTDQLAAPWNLLTNILGNGSTLTVDDPLAANKRFYRSSAPQ